MVSFSTSALICAAILSGIALVSGNMCQGGCTAGWVHFGDRCFMYTAAKKDWSDAELNCLSHGGNLASVHSDDEWRFIKALVKKNDPNENRFWIGMTDSSNEGKWLWSDGSKPVFTKWNRGEPNNAGLVEDCAEGNYAKSDGWNDVNCKNAFASVCAKPMD
ncbi:hypothetical protein JZ751_000935 [Albula glossodonta]|uniref:C-type lectin domain-containing protein n=1 Tax=Albula glossodonta TaxID=121402 RepID=A0A8T2PXS3_9TELE|nr:hypothetical protein JZ751_000935 [Albula glossodonta]